MTTYEIARDLSVDEARQRMVDCVRPVLSTESVELGQACGRTLAIAVKSSRDQPPFHTSAMDGYALRSIDSPGTLRVTGEASAGVNSILQINAGQSVRIFTGGPLPEGADAIAVQEDVQRSQDHVTVPAIEPSTFIRPRGSDYKAGTLLLSAGRELGAIELAVAASAGLGQINVWRRPRVALIPSGDEIVPAGANPGLHQIFDSISPALAALLRAWGAEVICFAPQPDEVTGLKDAFSLAFGQADLVVTVGGASVGDRDLLKPALLAFSPEFCVKSIAVKPGKPTWFASTSQGCVLGLPGNPASALICAHLFVRPVIEHMLGRAPIVQFRTAQLDVGVPANGSREHYLRAQRIEDNRGSCWVKPAKRQDSSLLSVYLNSNALVRLPANAPALDQGTRVQILSI